MTILLIKPLISNSNYQAFNKTQVDLNDILTKLRNQKTFQKLYKQVL